MKCERVQNLFSLYYDQEINREDERIIASHLVQCNHCEREWRKFTRAVCLIKSAKKVDPPRDYSEWVKEYQKKEE